MEKPASRPIPFPHRNPVFVSASRYPKASALGPPSPTQEKRASEVAEKPVLLKGTASAVPQVIQFQWALAPEGIVPRRNRLFQQPLQPWSMLSIPAKKPCQAPNLRIPHIPKHISVANSTQPAILKAAQKKKGSGNHRSLSLLIKYFTNKQSLFSILYGRSPNLSHLNGIL